MKKLILLSILGILLMGCSHKVTQSNTTQPVCARQYKPHYSIIIGDSIIEINGIIYLWKDIKK